MGHNRIPAKLNENELKVLQGSGVSGKKPYSEGSREDKFNGENSTQFVLDIVGKFIFLLDYYKGL